MTYELLNFSRIINTEINELSSGHDDPDQLDLELKVESNQIRDTLLQSIVLMEPEKCKFTLFQYQQAISTILNELENVIKNECQPSTQNELKNKNLKSCRKAAEDLLVLLKSDFPLYFDYSMLLNQAATERLKAKLKEQIAGCSDLLKVQGVDDETIEIFLLLFEQLLHPKKNFSYEQGAYLEDFFEQLNESCIVANKPLETLEIIQTIVSLNFNHPAFYHLCCNYFTEALEKCENITEQYRILNFLKKKFKQVFKLSISTYDRKLPVIEESVQRFLDAELDYLRSLEATAEDLSSTGLLESNFKVTLTIRQLALFIHLQVEANIILPQSPKVLHQYVTKHYSTIETEKISEKSFKNAYYGNKGTDVEKVIDKIVTMLVIAQEKY